MARAQPRTMTDVPAAAARDLVRQGRRLIARGRLHEAIAVFERAHALGPGDPDVLFGLAQIADRLGEPDKAAGLYGAVLMVRADAVEAANNLGNIQTRLGQYDAAIETFRAAIERAPETPELWLNLGRAVAATGDFENARTFYEQALALRPRYGEAYANLAELACGEGRLDDALPHYRRAIRLLPRDGQLRLNHALTLLTLGDLEAGWAEYEHRNAKGLARAITYRNRIRRWTGEDLTGKTLLVCAEQGLGDQILFASCLPDVIEPAGEVVIECEERLVPLFARSFPTAHVHPYNAVKREGRWVFEYQWLEGRYSPDFQIPMGSLPGLLRRSLADFPDRRSYLQADEQQVAGWQARLAELGPGPKVGICWRSGLLTPERRKEYLALTDWAPILRLPGVHFVNLQYDECTGELAEAETALGVRIHDFPALDQKNDLDGVAALIAALDAVISAPTTVSNISGALGVPTLRLMRERGFTTLGTDGEPFQPAVIPVFPERPGDWDAVLSAATQELRHLNARTASPQGTERKYDRLEL